VWLLAPGPANLDAWLVLDDMLTAAAGVLPIERVDFRSYVSPDSAATLPAYQVQFTEGIDL
jgi:hypothetical protein